MSSSMSKVMGKPPTILMGRESSTSKFDRHESSLHQEARDNAYGDSGATGRMAGTSRRGDESRLEREGELIASANAVAAAPRLASTVHENYSARRLRQRTYDSDDEEEIPPAEVARRVAEAEERRRQQEAERAAEIQAINAERAARGLGPARGAGLEGEIQRRAMLRRDAALGRRLDEDMGTSLGYEYLTKDGKLRNEFK